MMWPWRLKMSTQNLLMLMMKTVWCRFGRWSLVIVFVQTLSTRFQGLSKIFKVSARFWSWCSGKILKLKFGHHFAADAWLWLWSSFLVEILVWFLSLSFLVMVMVGWDFEDVWSRFVFELVIWPKEVSLVSRTQPSGPLCLWQCFLYYWMGKHSKHPHLISL